MAEQLPIDINVPVRSLRQQDVNSMCVPDDMDIPQSTLAPLHARFGGKALYVT